MVSVSLFTGQISDSGIETNCVSVSLFQSNASLSSNPIFLNVYRNTQEIITQIQDNPDLVNIKDNYFTLLQKIHDDYVEYSIHEKPYIMPL